MNDCRCWELSPYWKAWPEKRAWWEGNILCSSMIAQTRENKHENRGKFSDHVEEDVRENFLVLDERMKQCVGTYMQYCKTIAGRPRWIIVRPGDPTLFQLQIQSSVQWLLEKEFHPTQIFSFAHNWMLPCTAIVQTCSYFQWLAHHLCSCHRRYPRV